MLFNSYNIEIYLKKNKLIFIFSNIKKKICVFSYYDYCKFYRLKSTTDPDTA